MRILIAGPSGSGKTTFAARLGRILGIPHTEMDSLHWGPNWTPRPGFEADVHKLIEQPAWITEWQYPQVRGPLLERADVVIYLRYSRAVVMWRVIRRTLRRAVTGQKLWADNVEPPLWNILSDPDNMIRYTWRSYPHVGQLLAEARSQQLHTRFIEFRTPRAARHFLRAVQLRGSL